MKIVAYLPANKPKLDIKHKGLEDCDNKCVNNFV